MEVISVKFEPDFVIDMEKIMKRNRYATRAEFIREAIREKMKQLEREEIELRLRMVYGSSRRKTSFKQVQKAREAAFADLEKAVKQFPQANKPD